MDRTRIYLIGYILFMSGVFGALWELGTLKMIGPAWTVICVMIVIGIGLMISASSSRNKVNTYIKEFLSKDKKNTDSTTIIGVLFASKIHVYRKSYIFLYSGLCIYLFLSLLIFEEINFNIIYILHIPILLLIINQEVLKYRIKKGYYGNNTYEMKEIISFIQEHSKKNDFIDGDGIKKIFPELEKDKQKVFSEGVVCE